MHHFETAYIEADAVLHGVCLGCGMCSMICPTKALHTGSLSHHGGGRMPRIQSTLCVHCGNCAAICPSSTIHQPRLRQMTYAVRENPVHTMVFLCRNLLTLTPMCAEKKDIPPHVDLLEAHTAPSLSHVRAPQGARVEVVRCVHRVGPRFVDRLVEYGVRNFLLLACDDRHCRYQVRGFHRTPHLEMLAAVYEAHGIAVRMEVKQVQPSCLAEVQGMVDAFAAQPVVA